MKVVNLSNILKYRLYIIMFVAITVAIILIIYAFFYIFLSSINDKIDTNNIFNLDSYTAKYTITTTSNKTKNSYTIDEMYRCIDEKEYFKFIQKDFLGNDYIITIADNKLKIENSLQISRYITTISNINNMNLYSLKTYIDIINSGAFKVTCEKEDITLKYTVDLKCILENEKAKSYREILQSKLCLDTLELYIIANKPSYVKCMSKGNEVIKIEYIEFIQNAQIDMSIFEV